MKRVLLVFWILLARCYSQLDVDTVVTPKFTVSLRRSTQTIEVISPFDEPEFNFVNRADTPRDRTGDRNFHLGDLTIRARIVGESQFTGYNTATGDVTVDRLPLEENEISAVDLTKAVRTFGALDPLPLTLSRRLSVDQENGDLLLKVVVENNGQEIVEIGALGVAMVFDNYFTGRTLEDIGNECSFVDPYIGGEGGFLQVTKASGQGSALLVFPEHGTRFEQYQMLTEDPTPRGVTFEGWYTLLVHAKAWQDIEWANAESWNPGTNRIFQPGDRQEYTLRFSRSDDIRSIDSVLVAHDRPVVTAVPGYVISTEMENAALFIESRHDIADIEVDHTNVLDVQLQKSLQGEQHKLLMKGLDFGRARITVTYVDGPVSEQYIHIFVLFPFTAQVDNYGTYSVEKMWYTDRTDVFERFNSFMNFNLDTDAIILEESRAWIAGLSDECGAGPSLAMGMKNLYRPNKEEIRLLELYVHDTLLGDTAPDGQARLESDIGIRASMFYSGRSDFNYTVLPGWDQPRAETTFRSYNYPHPTALFWALYRLARYTEGLVQTDWQFYLKNAADLIISMDKNAPDFAQFGLMVGSVYKRVLDDLQKELWTDKAYHVKNIMHDRALVWDNLPFPFGSEMPWDSTGQEEVYTWTKYFGLFDSSNATLEAVLGYTPNIPSWGYHGNARRYFDFLVYGGLSIGSERGLHHYGAPLNAIPILDAYRTNPDDFYLLKVGIGAITGTLTNIQQDGARSMCWHGDPSLMKPDPYNCDYGVGFYGHAIESASYFVNHPTLGHLCFLCDIIEVSGDDITFAPRESFHSRIYLEPVGLWLQLDTGTFESATFNLPEKTLKLILSPGGSHFPFARITLQKTSLPGVREGSNFHVVDAQQTRGAFRVALQPSNVAEAVIQWS